jgi:hypothetical protein
MAIQPCGCGSTELDWPYAHADFDPAETNGLQCGEDENGDTLMWAYPGPEFGGFVATKDEAAGIGSGSWLDFGAMTERAGASYFNGSSVFTAPRAGMYAVTFKAAMDICDPEACDIYLRVATNYAAWATSNHSCSGIGDDGPYLQTHDASVAFLGGYITLSGDLPALDGGTLTYEVYHNFGSNKEFHDIYLSALWKCPIPD